MLINSDFFQGFNIHLLGNLLVHKSQIGNKSTFSVLLSDV